MRVYACISCAHLDDDLLLCMNNETKFNIGRLDDVKCDSYMYLPGSDADEHPLTRIQGKDVNEFLRKNFLNWRE